LPLPAGCQCGELFIFSVLVLLAALLDAVHIITNGLNKVIECRGNLGDDRVKNGGKVQSSSSCWICPMVYMLKGKVTLLRP
jgi:hypothetical protein